MKLIKYISVFIQILSMLFGGILLAQMDELHGDYSARAKGLYSANRIRCTFYNDGNIGGRSDQDYRLDWPKNNIDKARYLYDSVPIVGAEVIDVDNQLIHIVSETHGSTTTSGAASSGDLSPTDDWWTWLPLPGFHNPTAQEIAMSDNSGTWPGFWPDKYFAEDPGWSRAWNGYFGKDRFNADQESYYVFDDWANEEFNFFPDSTNLMRRGLGFRVTARGLQWSNVLVEDILFMLYDVKNIGTHLHDRVVFGYKFGMGVGASSSASDNDDDGGKYLLDEDLAISFDVDDAGKPGGWSPVGMIGFSFLESPGNAIDGIDNDQDGQNGSGMVIAEETFAPKILNQGDDIVFIDYKTFERYTAKAFEENLSNPSFSMDQDSIKIFFLKKVIAFTPGDTLQEVTMEQNIDNIDNNLNGLIDEGKGSIFGIDPRTQVKRFLYVGNLSVDYLTGFGLDNLLIDERRDDGIDNNNNWSPYDDVGLDGNKNEMDEGQGDGIPTSGWRNGIDTEQPGEPHIDKTDINESDMIGLTSFELLKPYTVMPLYDDERVWKSLVPGYLDDIVSIGDDTDISFGSGYFTMFPEQIERFSLSFQLAYTEENLIRIKNWGALAYAENYQFATAPNTPTLKSSSG